MNVTKAIIPVAGWGTRRLPITKAIEKCMLPVGNRPIVDYVVQDCLKAGITEIYFVVGEQSTQLRDFYRSNIPLNDYLVANGKSDKLPLVAPLKDVKLHFVVQPSYGRYGTAIPVALCADYIKEDESVVVLMGDDFIHNEDGSSEVARLIAKSSDDGAAMLGVNVEPDQVSRYGVLKLSEHGEYESIVEKPSVEEAPSTLINVSKYLLPKKVIDLATTTPINPIRGEYEITDAVNKFVKDGGKVNVVEAEGEYLDSGSLEGWLHANNRIANS